MENALVKIFWAFFKTFITYIYIIYYQPNINFQFSLTWLVSWIFGIKSGITEVYRISKKPNFKAYSVRRYVINVNVSKQTKLLADGVDVGPPKWRVWWHDNCVHDSMKDISNVNVLSVGI